MRQSNGSDVRGKTRKPHREFPLFPHASGRWTKKVRGKFEYFGKVSADPKGEAALQKWLDEKDDLLAGRRPRKRDDGLVVRDLLNQFLTAKTNLKLAGEINQRTFGEYYGTAERLKDHFGVNRRVDDLAADDFESLRASLAKTRGPVALGNEITRVKMVFKFAWDNALIEKPIRYGQAFSKPSAKVLRKARAAAGERMFEPAELRTLIDTSETPVKAMVLLALNGGFGQNDVASLPNAAVDFEAGFVTFPRPKTGVSRRCPLWPETVKALKEAIKARVVPRDDADAELVFINPRGRRWVREVEGDNPEKWNTRVDLVGLAFSRLVKTAKVDAVKGRGFYTLRHVFRTIADECRDPAAIDRIMGHSPATGDMGAVYRERISDERLKVVTDHVRSWLFAEKSK